MLIMMAIMLFPLVGLALFAWLPLRESLPVYLSGLAASVALTGAMRRSMRLPVQTGTEGMIGRSALVLEWRGESGWVLCGSERWRAETRARDAVRPGATVRVASVDSMTLIVEEPGSTEPESNAPRANLSRS